MRKDLIVLGIGVVIGLILFGFFKKTPPPKIVTKTEVITDTVYVTLSDTIYVTKNQIKQVFVRDTVMVKPFEPKIRAFKTSKAFLYGNTTVEGEVLGEVLQMSIVNDFKIPQITNTKTVTNTITKRPSGLYLTAGLNQQLLPNVGALVIRNTYLIQYQYHFENGHSIGVGKKLF